MAQLSPSSDCHEIPYTVRVAGASRWHSPLRAIFQVLRRGISGKIRFGLLSRGLHRGDIQEQEEDQGRQRDGFLQWLY